jgi:hypothetical protein
VQYDGALSNLAVKLVKEPLLHFLVAGGLLFASYAGLHRGAQRSDNPRRIESTGDDIWRLEIAWLARWRRPPTPTEAQGAIEEQVKEEILYREALVLGLEEDDTIIKGRLADVAALREPAPGEVEAWCAKNRERFAPPPLATFRHLFFSADKRGALAEADARKAIATLGGEDRAGSAMSLRRGSLPTSSLPSGQHSPIPASSRPPCASMKRVFPPGEGTWKPPSVMQAN